MGGSGSKTVLNELHGLQERLIDGLAAPELADQRAENARLRALLGDAVRVIGQLRGVDGDDAAAGDAEAKEAAAAAPRPFRAAELDDAVAVRSRAAVDDLAPVDADAVIRRGVPWSDPDFPAANVPSLGDAATVAAKRWGDVAWVRARALAPRGRIFVQNPSPYDVAQGGLGDCYLLSALCVLAERPGRVHRLFRTTEVNAAGIYGARLYLHGEKRLVLVDDALPARDGRPLFAASRTDGELWVSLYEKAFAKVYGSYAAIEAGSTAAVLETLTGAPSTRTRLRAGVADAAAAADRLWELASAAAARGHVAALSVGDHPQDLQKLVGIVEEHAYAVLGARQERGGARLLKLRNPWANGVEWRGAWSDGSDEWSDDLRRTLGHDVAADGVFFMSVEDVANVFDEVAVCAVDDHAQYSHSPRLAFAAGGARAAALKVRPSRSGSFAVSIRQPDVRAGAVRADSYRAVRFRAIRLAAGAGMPAHLGTSGDAFEGARDCRAAWALEGGATYLVVVETYDAAAKGDGPLDGTFVCSTYGPARCACTPLAHRAAELALADAFGAFARLSPEAEAADYAAWGDGGAGVTLRTWSRDGESALALLWTNATAPPAARVLEETVTFALEGADVARATLDADGRVVALAVVDPVVKVALPPGTSSLLLVRKLPAAKAYSVSYRRSARLRAARG